jgi:hypothetical protein
MPPSLLPGALAAGVLPAAFTAGVDARPECCRVVGRTASWASSCSTLVLAVILVIIALLPFTRRCR